jgi:hypothetical protein
VEAAIEVEAGRVGASLEQAKRKHVELIGAVERAADQARADEADTLYAALVDVYRY